MEILSDFEDEYCSKVGSFACREKTAEWNERTIKALAVDEGSVLSQVNRMHAVMMSRPSEVDIELVYRYEEDRGSYIEARVSGSWGGSSSSLSDSKTKAEPSNNSSSSDN